MTLFLFPRISWANDESSSPVISRITINATDIFDFTTNPYINKFPYSWINFLHIQTKQQIIEQELLFKVGDRVDTFILKETERNLRSLSFIQAARVSTYPQRDGTVAVVVFVSDAWTTEPQLNIGGQNKVNEVEFGFKEKNVLGYGKNIQFLYKKSPGSIERVTKYEDTRLLGSRWKFSAQAINKTLGESRSFILAHPFFAADTPWAVSSSHEQSSDVVGDFVDNLRVSEFEQIKETNEVAGGVKVGGGRDIVNHVGLRYKKESIRYALTDKTSPTRVLPAHQNFQTVFMDYETVRNKFIALTRLEKMTRVEDINLGPRLAISPGVSPEVLRGKAGTERLQASYEEKLMIRDDHLLSGDLRFSGRDVFKHETNARTSAEFRYYYRGAISHTLVTHSRLEWGHSLDPDNQIPLGADNGLRAFKTDQFIGNKSWVLNIEDRRYFVDDFLNLISVGAAGFFDMGYAWGRGRPVDLTDLKSSVGAGLRFGLTKSSSEVVVRIDASYRLQTLPNEKTRWVITFGTGQAF